MKRRLLTTAGLAVVLLMPGSASADEPVSLPAEVQACLAYYPEAVVLGGETDAVDIICMAADQVIPTYAAPGDVYLWGAPSADEPIQVITEPDPCPACPPAEGNLEPPAAPEDVEAFAVSSSVAKVRWDPIRAYVADSGQFGRSLPAVKYVVKCEGHKARTYQTKVRLRAQRGDVCQVRGLFENGVTSWSKKVRVKRHS